MKVLEWDQCFHFIFTIIKPIQIKVVDINESYILCHVPFSKQSVV